MGFPGMRFSLWKVPPQSVTDVNTEHLPFLCKQTLEIARKELTYVDLMSDTFKSCLVRIPGVEIKEIDVQTISTEVGRRLPGLPSASEIIPPIGHGARRLGPQAPTFLIAIVVSNEA